MAGRIRTIKPDFWTDGAMIALSPFARLFYIGTWNFTLCDRGHLPDDAQGLKLRILPADNVDVVAILAELVDNGRIERFGIGDRTFLRIRRFGDHQKVDPRWKSRCPACRLEETLEAETPGDSPELPEPRLTSSALLSTGSESAVGGERRGEERRGGEGNVAVATLAPPPRKCPNHIDDPSSPPCGACKDARITRDEWDREHPVPVKPSSPNPSGSFDCPDHPGYPHPSLPHGCPRCIEEGLS